jgi:hypothetical protein
MENLYVEIKKSIIASLRTIDPECDISAEEICKTGDSYYFVDILPMGNQTVDAIYSDIRIMIDLSYYQKGGSNAVYWDKAAALDSLFCPIFQVMDRKITVADSNWRIVDRVLHYTFHLAFRISGTEEGSGTLMEELII